MVERNERSADAVIEAYKAGVDRTLITRNLTLSPEQRLLQLMELIRLAEELRAAGKRAAGRPEDLEAIAELEAIRELTRG